MECPKCRQKLEVLRLGKMELDRCGDCQGLWFDNNELAQMLADYRALESIPPKNQSKSLAPTGGCPRCNVPLTISRSMVIPELEIDHCSSCHGIWLDFGEYDQLRARQMVTSNPVTRNQGSPYASYRAGAIKHKETANALYMDHFASEAKRQEVYRLSKAPSRNIKPFVGVEQNRISKDSHEWRGKVRILISGFSIQKVVTIKDIATAIELLPDVHLQALKVIMYDPKRIMQSMGYHNYKIPNKSIVGHYLMKTYFSNNTSIIIYKFSTKRGFLRILYHEIGHHVFHHVLNLRMKNKWSLALHRNGKFVSQYAKTNESENFSETYLYFVLYPRILRQKDPDKYNFMEEKVFLKFQLQRFRLID